MSRPNDETTIERVGPGCRCEDEGESGGCACGRGCRCAPCDCAAIDDRSRG